MKKEYREMRYNCNMLFNNPKNNIVLKEVKGLVSRFKLAYTYMRGFNKNVASVADIVVSSMGKVYIYYLIKLDSEIIGSFCLKNKNKNEIILYNFTILPKYQHEGYGKDSLKSIQKLCKELNYNCLCVKVKSKNTVALRLYKECGFI